jgi:RNA polymerase sigma-70 factor (ECF subfamily)
MTSPESRAPNCSNESGAADRIALETLFRAEYDGLCDFVERSIHEPAVAEDIVQGVFLRVWQRRAVLPVTQVSRAYLYSAARNAVIQRGRHGRVVRQWQETQAATSAFESVAESVDAELELSELNAAVARAVASLPERRRLVFTLSRNHGLRYAEIAEMLGISVGTVEIHMNRALKTLRAILAPYLAILLLTLR